MSTERVKWKIDQSLTPKFTAGDLQQTRKSLRIFFYDVSCFAFLVYPLYTPMLKYVQYAYYQVNYALMFNDKLSAEDAISIKGEIEGCIQCHPAGLESSI